MKTTKTKGTRKTTTIKVSLNGRKKKKTNTPMNGKERGGHPYFVTHTLTASPSPFQEIIDLIREKNAKRKHVVKQMIRNDNACAAPVRRGLGFDWEKSKVKNIKDEEEAKSADKYRNKMAREVAAVIKAVNLEQDLDMALFGILAEKEKGTKEWKRKAEKSAKLEAELKALKEKFTPLQGKVATDCKDVILAHRNAKIPFQTIREEYEKDLATLVKQLPIWPWVEKVKGFGEQSLASLIGEVGDLSNYANPAKLWKRMCVAVIEGEAQGKRTDEKLAALHGHNPSRRSVMWNIEKQILMAQLRNVKDEDGERTEESTASGPLGELYLERKQFELTKYYEKKDGEVIPVWLGLAHKRAQRYMGKRLLRELWRAWRESQSPGVLQRLSASHTSAT